MKRKFWEILFTLIAALCLCFGLVACDSSEGTYYLFENDEYRKETYFVLKGGKWTDEDGESGDYEVDGEKITFFVDFFGQRMEFTEGTVKNGILTLNDPLGDEPRTFAKEGAAHMHDYGEWTTQTPSTCTVQGTEVRICKTCGKYKSRSLPLAPHPYGEWQEMTLPTCTEAGEKKHVCTACSYEEWDTIEALGHEWNAGTVTVPVTCETNGEKYYICLRDADHQKTEILPALGHEYTVENKCIRFEDCGKEWEFTEGLDFTLDEEKGTYTVSGIGSASGEVVIPCGYEGKWVTTIGSEAFRGCSSLESITIPDSVTSIGERAFSGSGLTEITIPDSVTSIGSSAFYGCSGLTEITIPDSVTSIGDYAFYNCSGLQSVSFGNKSKLTSIGNYAFYDCSGLTEITIPDSVTSIGYNAFYGCSGLTSVTIGSGVTSIGDWAFEGCSGLTEITIPNSVTSIGDYAFQNCSGLTSVTIGSGVTSIGDYAFSGCSGLEKIKVAEGNTNYSSQDGILYNKEKTKFILIPAKLKGDVVIPNGVISIGAQAFSGRSGLTEITISDSVTSIGQEAFHGCSGLTSIAIPDSVTSIGSSAFYGTAYYNDDSHWTENVLYIGNHLIRAKSAISGSYSIRGGTKTIAGSAFSGCRKLTSVIIPDSVISIGYNAFFGCSGLTSVTIGSGVTSIGDLAFYDCSGLTEITIPNSVTSIGDRAFYDCSGLKTVMWNAENCTKVRTYLDPIFAGCTHLSTVTFGDNVKTIPPCAFYDCDGLTEITIPSSVTLIGYSAFHGCSGLEKVYFENPNGWEASWVSDSSPIDVSGLGNPETAAKYLKSTYCGYYWKRYN